jgi:hypothetical protein
VSIQGNTGTSATVPLPSMNGMPLYGTFQYIAFCRDLKNARIGWTTTITVNP